MDRRRGAFCVLCNRSEETETTGALSSKDHVTAHQNCLLFSSGIYCQSTPQFDDLFGFSVEDVVAELKRGSRLKCSKCKKSGATAGCEVRHCKRSYHYPCAVQAEAQTVEDPDKGKYILLCFKHKQGQENNTSVKGCSSSSKPPGEAGPSKVNCLACERTEGNVSLEHLSNNNILMYCDKHAPSSHKRKLCAEGLSDSDFSDSVNRSPSKRQLTFIDDQQESPKRKCEGLNGIVTDDSSDPDEDAPDADMAMFGPLESDIEESQSLRKDTESPTGSVSGQQLENESREKAGSDDETDIESESLLSPERSSMETPPATTAATQTESPFKIVKTEDGGFSPEQGPVHTPSVQQQSSIASPPYSDTSSPPCSSSSIPQAPVENISPAEVSAEPKARFDSSSFWKSCNAAGCTQAIFSDFTAEMNRVSGRIQSGQASQEDYDLALRVMEASGKLAELVTKQQEDLKHKQMEMQKAAAAMKEVVSTLKR